MCVREDLLKVADGIGSVKPCALPPSFDPGGFLGDPPPPSGPINDLAVPAAGPIFSEARVHGRKARISAPTFESLSLGCYSPLVPQRRNLGGPRREASERVSLRPIASGEEISAWTLNLSRGGLRLVVEDSVFVGSTYLVAIGDETPRRATVVWTREEADGQIAGMRFDDVDGGEVPSSTPPVP